MVLRIFDCDLCMIATLDLLAHPHSKQFMEEGVNKLIIPAKIGLFSKRKGRPSFVVSGLGSNL